MFTGLIETVGIVKAVNTTAVGRRLIVDLGAIAAGVKAGDSIAVNGVCLTVSQIKADQASFDVMAVTARDSTLGRLKTGEMVNLERALPADGRFGGHFVQGHVDGVGTIDKLERGKAQYTLWITADADLLELMVKKGAVAVDGVSLTIVELGAKRFSVSLIPTTLKATNLGQKKVADKVNLEADLIIKVIKKRLDQILRSDPAAAQLSGKKLHDQGFA